MAIPLHILGSMFDPFFVTCATISYVSREEMAVFT